MKEVVVIDKDTLDIMEKTIYDLKVALDTAYRSFSRQIKDIERFMHQEFNPEDKTKWHEINKKYGFRQQKGEL